MGTAGVEKNVLIITWVTVPLVLLPDLSVGLWGDCPCNLIGFAWS